MPGIHSLKADRVIKAVEKAGWENLGRQGKHFKLQAEGLALFYDLLCPSVVFHQALDLI